MKFTPLLLACLVASPAAWAQNAAAPAPEPSLPFVVQKSDKLIRLSRDLLIRPTDWAEVARFNGMPDPNLIFPGQKLNIPLRLMKSKPAAARVVSAEGTVTLGGAPVAAGAALVEGARLETGPNSSAVIELGDGSRVKLLPRTLAEVLANRDYAMRDASASRSTNWFSGAMRLAQGALETVAARIANRAQPLEVKTPTSTIGVRGTEFRVAFDDPATRNARTEVIEGRVQADNSEQKSSADVPGGKGALVNPAEREIKVVPLLPAPDLSASPAEVLKPLGNWPLPVLAGAAAFRVQVASDDKFEKIVRDLKVATAGAVELGSLDIANWYARVRGIDADGIEGFDAVKPLAVKARLRVTDSSMQHRNGRTELRFTLDAAAAGPIQAVLSRERTMAQPVLQATLAETRWDLGALPQGTYYVQFRVGTPPVVTEAYELEITDSWGLTVFDSSFSLHLPR
ncbi:MAG: FecR domain-containing protein [Burkholderiales bacterium]|nr:FecR domain-containing protein [Burkholderiales bacterium]